MKLHEILCEAIDLTSHALQIKEQIFKALARAANLPDRDFRDISRTRVQDTGSLMEPMTVVEQRLPKSIEYYLSKTLSDIATSIFVPDRSSYIPVDFKDINASAHVSGLSVTFSNEWISKLTSQLQDLIYTTTLDELPAEDQLFDMLMLVLGNSNNMLLRGMYHNHRFVKQIEEMVSVFIHEMTHLAQHFPQFMKGRSSLEYRSYAGKNKDFHTLHLSRSEPGKHDSWYAMYLASPQEIAARAQELALQILDDEGIAYAYDHKEIPTTQQVARVLPSYIDNWYPAPKNDLERKVRNRYYKLAYQQIDRHLEQLRSKQKR